LRPVLSFSQERRETVTLSLRERVAKGRVRASGLSLDSLDLAKKRIPWKLDERIRDRHCLTRTKPHTIVSA
jgi:hypothetical protein